MVQKAKNPLAMQGTKEMCLVPESGRSSGGGNGNLLQHSCFENSMDRGAWRVTVHGVAKSDTTEQLSTHTYTDKIWNYLICLWASLVAQKVKNLPAVQEI